MPRPRTSAAACLAALLVLTACGESDDPTIAAPSASASADGTESPEPTTSPQECPLQPKVVEAPAGATTDLAVKPVVAKTDAKPTEVEVSDIVEGSGDEVQAGDQVTVKYVGVFADTAEEFDSSWSRGPDETLPFTACAQGVIPGFAIGPLGMKVGGRRQIVIPPDLGYGPQGNPRAGIEGTDVLIFVVDLVEVG